MWCDKFIVIGHGWGGTYVLTYTASSELTSRVLVCSGSPRYETQNVDVIINTMFLYFTLTWGPWPRLVESLGVSIGWKMKY